MEKLLNCGSLTKRGLILLRMSDDHIFIEPLAIFILLLTLNFFC